MTTEEHIINGVYNLGDALWAIFGSFLILALSIYLAGSKIAKAIAIKNRTEP